MPKALVVGALGVVGRANVEYLTTLPDWSVVALSRRAPDFDTRAQFISCDVTDRNALRSALAGHPDITNVIFAALHEQPTGLVAGWSEADTVHTNVASRGVYDRHRYDTEKADALNRLAHLVASIVNPPTGNVVALPRKR